VAPRDGKPLVRASTADPDEARGDRADQHHQGAQRRCTDLQQERRGPEARAEDEALRHLQAEQPAGLVKRREPVSPSIGSDHDPLAISSALRAACCITTPAPVAAPSAAAPPAAPTAVPPDDPATRRSIDAL